MKNKELEAAQVLQEAEQKRIRECYQEIEKILEKYDCKLETDVRFLGVRMFRQVIVLPRKGGGSPVAFPGGENGNPVLE